VKKKVLHIRSSGGLLGAENVILELCKRAAENNYTVVAGAIKNSNDPYPEFLDAAQKLSIDTVVFPCKNQFDIRCAWAIKKYVRRNNIDIIHTHGYKEDYFTFLSRVTIPKIATNHLWKKTDFKDRFYCLLDSFFLKKFDRVVGVSGEIVQELHDKKIPRAMKIANGIDIKKFSLNSQSNSLLREFGIDRPTEIIGMISSITPEKGHEIALRAFAKVVQSHRSAKLLVVGEGNQISKVKGLSKELNIEQHIVFTGKRTDIPELLSIIDIFLLTSFTEGLPMALLEAMAAGKAVVATDVGEIPEVLEDGINGLLIKPGDVRGTENAINRLLSMDVPSRKKLGACAAASVAERFSSESMAKNYFALYDSLLTPERHLA